MPRVLKIVIDSEKLSTDKDSFHATGVVQSFLKCCEVFGCINNLRLLYL